MDEKKVRIDNIESCIDLFYKDRIAEAMNSFQEVLSDMSFLAEKYLEENDESDSSNVTESELKDIFVDIMQAMEKEDYVMMADIIKYDFLDLFNSVGEISD